MKRILILLTATLLLQGVDAHAGVVSEKRWKQYKTWAKAFYPERDVALAVAPNGSNCSHYGVGQAQAKANALRCCKTSLHNPSSANCKIVDVNFKSKNRGSSTASTSGSKSVWCATKHSFWKVNRTSACGSAKVFSSRYQAEFEHQRLKKYVGLKSNKPSAAVEKDCYEKFHEQNGRKWRADVVGGDTDQDFDVTKCFPFVSKDLLTWLGSDSPASSSSTSASSS